MTEQQKKQEEQDLEENQHDAILKSPDNLRVEARTRPCLEDSIDLSKNTKIQEVSEHESPKKVDKTTKPQIKNK